ncbi:MAG: CBS domain-containing protein [Candidatus Moduliflexus flocculans]|nr:CBS domain-containing protein [Candidatus Moduliflexus flocculans]
MRDRGFSGVPVVEGGRLAGIVSIGDILSALDGGWIGEKAESRMTRSVIVLEDDMPLTFGITYHQRYRYGRFPVLDKSGKLVGILTPTDIIRSLLVEMNREVERLESRLKEGTEPPGERHPPPGLLHGPLRLRERGPGLRGHQEGPQGPRGGSRGHPPGGHSQLRAGAEPGDPLGGRLHDVHPGARADRGPGRGPGPGIPDLDEAMREGYSTADEWIRSLGFGAGMGLPNARAIRGRILHRVRTRPRHDRAGGVCLPARSGIG